MKAIAYLIIFLVVSLLTYGIFSLCNWSYKISDWSDDSAGGLGTLLVIYLLACSVIYALKKEDEI